jgi:hypothetical protein
MSSLIKNQAAADAVSAMLSSDTIHHPGNPDTKQQAADLLMPTFRPKHMPAPYADAIRNSNQTLAEAIVYHIENTLEATIIATSELEELRADLNQAVADLAASRTPESPE